MYDAKKRPAHYTYRENTPYNNDLQLLRQLDQRCTDCKMCIYIICVHKNSNNIMYYTKYFHPGTQTAKYQLPWKPWSPPSLSAVQNVSDSWQQEAQEGCRGEMRMVDDYAEDATLFQLKKPDCIGQGWWVATFPSQHGAVWKCQVFSHWQ